MNIPAICQHAFSYDDAGRSTNVLLCSSWAQKYSSWVLNAYTFITQKVAIFAEKNSKITSLMSWQRSDLWKTLKCSQSWDLDGIQWILWTHTDAAAVYSTVGGWCDLVSKVTRGQGQGCYKVKCKKLHNSRSPEVQQIQVETLQVGTIIWWRLMAILSMWLWGSSQDHYKIMWKTLGPISPKWLKVSQSHLSL